MTYRIYTLDGKKIARALKGMYYYNILKVQRTEELIINLADDKKWGRRYVLKDADTTDGDIDDTAYFYQIRKVLESRDKSFVDNENCLKEIILIVDFGNFFRQINKKQDTPELFPDSHKKISEKSLPDIYEELSDMDRITDLYEKGFSVIFPSGNKVNFIPADKSASMARTCRMFFMDESIITKQYKVMKHIVEDSYLNGSDSVKLYCSFNADFQGVDWASGKITGKDFGFYDAEPIIMDGYPGYEIRTVLIDEDAVIKGISNIESDDMPSKISMINKICYFNTKNKGDENSDNNLIEKLPPVKRIDICYEDIFFDESTLNKKYKILEKLPVLKTEVTFVPLNMGTENEPIYIRKVVDGDVCFCYVEESIEQDKIDYNKLLNDKDIINLRLDLGMDFSGVEAVFSKMYAYKGLYLSSGFRIPLLELNEKTVIVVDDAPEYNFTVNNVSIFTNAKEYDKERITWEYKENAEFEIKDQFDGEGIISPKYRDIINEYLKKHATKAISAYLGQDGNRIDSFQVRMPFVKGMLHSIDFKSFFDEMTDGEENASYIIKDYWGIERDLREAEIILTKSMFKAAGWIKELWEKDILAADHSHVDDPMEYYFEQLRRYDHALYISGTDIPYTGRKLSYTSYQYLNTLAMKKEELGELVQAHLYFAKNLRDYYPLVNRKFANGIKEQNEDDIDSDTANNSYNIEDSENWLAAWNMNPKFASNKYVQDKLKGTFNYIMKNFSLGKILVSGEVRYLSRDLLLLLLYLYELYLKNSKGEENYKVGDLLNCENTDKGISGKESDNIKRIINELLESEEFYMPKDNIKLKAGNHYPIYRNPHLSRNEQCVLKKVNSEAGSIRDKYLGHLKAVIMVSRESYIPNVLGGADFDGDIVKIFNSDVIRDAVLRGVYHMDNEYDSNKKYERQLAIVDITPFEKQNNTQNDKKKRVTSRIDYKTIEDTFSSSIGMISNYAVRRGLSYYKPEFQEEKYDSEDEDYQGKMDKSCAACTIRTGLEIDACKTGLHPSLGNKIDVDNSKNSNQYSGFDFLNNYYKGMEEYYNYHKSMPKFETKQNAVIFKVGKKQYKMKLDEGEGTPLKYLPRFVIENRISFTVKYYKNEEDNQYYFEFEKNKKWKKDLDEKKLTEIRSIVNDYNNADRVITVVFKKQDEDKALYSIYKSYIYKILRERDDNINPENIEESLYELIRDSLRDENIADYCDKILKHPLLQEWPFTKENNRKRNLAELLKKDSESVDDFVSRTGDKLDQVLDFRNNGYFLLYLFIKEIYCYEKGNSSDNIKKYIEEAEKEKKGNNINDDEKYYKKFMETFDENKDSNKGCIRKELLNKCKVLIENILKDEKEHNAFMLLYAATDNGKDKLFWQYYGSKAICDEIGDIDA